MQLAGQLRQLRHLHLELLAATDQDDLNTTIELPLLQVLVIEAIEDPLSRESAVHTVTFNSSKPGIVCFGKFLVGRLANLFG